jgi:hypothetical protein
LGFPEAVDMDQGEKETGSMSFSSGEGVFRWMYVRFAFARVTYLHYFWNNAKLSSRINKNKFSRIRSINL